jgi:hypothetical protein
VNPFFNMQRKRIIEKIRALNRRLIIALVCYLILIVVALYAFLPVRSSYDRFLLGLVLCVFAILIVKTIAHSEDDTAE